MLLSLIAVTVFTTCKYVDYESLTHSITQSVVWSHAGTINATLHQVPDWISYSRESTEAYRSAQRMAALSHDKMVATLTMYLPDHDVKG